ncbi:unnamed protein product [Cyprideis torosa]|uniref:Large ribosomal subunit protein mL51 n=1 Tax=Cyprideis torosa TaxID=163714 RepID=A0A7R8ZL13_9CRUS|nr:unnamed protein product [Cyprideis torosa]CAG0882664.1 unnamed protein product [Cyprideis torosa]
MHMGRPVSEKSFMGHEYFKDRASREPILYRYGMDDKTKRSGLLPRDPSQRDTPYKHFPKRRLRDSWAEHRAYQGQNDYIDILGDGNVKPEEVAYEVPEWLRAFNKPELHRLLRKRDLFDDWMCEHRPKAWLAMHRRIRYLYWKMNYYWKPNWVYEREALTYQGKPLRLEKHKIKSIYK